MFPSIFHVTFHFVSLLNSFQGCDGQEDPESADSPQRSVYFIGGIAGGSVAFALGLGAFLTCFYKRTRKHNDTTHLVVKSMFMNTYLLQNSHIFIMIMFELLNAYVRSTS